MFRESVGGADAAAEIRRREAANRGLHAIEDVPATPGPNASAAERRRFEAFKARQKQQQPSAEPAPAPIVQVAAPNVQVLMPGGAAPARPVAASKIGGRRT